MRRRRLGRKLPRISLAAATKSARWWTSAAREGEGWTLARATQ